jgi:bifunctional UDP-N-acetylglucosamine pyrophosphorylase/glucosamine-1-phosphate N-acetyltransferase
MQDLYVLILAAGKGTRMKSNKAKVLHPLCGMALIEHVWATASRLSSQNTYIVIGQDAEKVKAQLSGTSAKFVYQKEQLGTGHAVMAAYEELKDKTGHVLVLYGDTPVITLDTLKNLTEAHIRSNAAATLLTAYLDNPYGYGRVIRNRGSGIEKIVEEKDTTAYEQEIKEINTGIYCFNIPALYQALKEVKSENAQGEYYLTDVIAVLKGAGKKVESITIADPSEVLGINTRAELAEMEKKLRATIAQRWMEDGVTIIDPDTTYIDAQALIGRDTTIYPQVIIEKHAKIGENCTVHAFSRISNSELEDNVTVWQSTVIVDSHIGRDTTVGPFAHVREHTEVGAQCRVGNFVEIKKSKLGNGTKAAHLAYIGDAEIGERVNIGAGTITCNYDGKRKSKTIIEDDVFIGSDSQLIAPVRIGKGAYVAAGSSITDDVPPYALGIARGRQVIKEDWAKKKLDKEPTR